MRSAHLTRGAVRVTLFAVLAALLPLSFSSAAAQPQASTASTVKTVKTAPVTAAQKKARWAPPVGVLLNDPTTANRRVILARVIQAINRTPRGETIRIVVWNLDDRPTVGALIKARRRGVTVQVVVSGVVDNPNWTRLKTALDRNRTDSSFAKKCRGACRSSGPITHAKIYLFSRVNDTRYTAMFGSSNLATPAGNRQWNDLVTVRNRGVYNHFVKTFSEYSRDRALANPYSVRSFGNTRVTLFPAGERNPVLQELRRVRCTGATSNGGRTSIRIAIAGWFDAYGGAIANQVRTLWDRGCDVKIVTTLAGGGVNRTLKANTGRGPVPIRNISVDSNEDGVPERYLHLKALAINGVYDGDTSASVFFTGSPNWSKRAQKSDEVWVRMLNRPGMVAQYSRLVNALYASPSASAKLSSPGLTAKRGATEGAPGVFELN